MKNRNNDKFWLAVSIICIVLFVVLSAVTVCSDVYAGELEDLEVAISESESEVLEEEDSIWQKFISLLTNQSEESTDLDAEETALLWQAYIDKYIMPNALAVLTGISMVFAVFSKFKTILLLYQENKAEFDEEKAEIFADLKEQVSGIVQTLLDVKSGTEESISSLPIEQIQSDISCAKEAITAEMECLQDFTSMFEIFLTGERKMLESSYMPSQDKKYMRKLYYEGEQLAKKRGETLQSVSDFVLSQISGTTLLAEDDADSTVENGENIVEVADESEATGL